MPRSPCSLSRCISMQDLSIGLSIAFICILPSAQYFIYSSLSLSIRSRSIHHLFPSSFGPSIHSFSLIHPYLFTPYTLCYPYPFIVGLSIVYLIILWPVYPFLQLYPSLPFNPLLYIVLSLSIRCQSIHCLFPSSFGPFIYSFSFIHPYLLIPSYTSCCHYPFVVSQSIVYSHHPLARLSIPYTLCYPYPFAVGLSIIYSHDPLARLSIPLALSIHTF